MVDWTPSESDSGESTEVRPDGGTKSNGDKSSEGQSTEELERQLARVREERDEARAKAKRLESAVADERTRNEALCDAIEELTAVVSANADGNLGKSPESTDIDSITPLYEAYDDLLLTWRDTVDRMSSFSEQVSAATDSVDNRIGSVRTASRDVSSAVDGISDGSERQNDRIQDISGEMRSLSATIEEIAASANEVAATSSDAAERGGSAQESATDAITELETLTEHAEETVETVSELNELLTDIEDIVGFITEIADQTNILALNANIEAARAGDAGDGFAVVAEEVKSLADETKQATDEIESSIERVHDQAEATVDEMHQTSESVEKTRETVEEAIEELDTVVEQVRDIDVSVTEIDDATETQAQSTEEIVSMVDEVGEISDRTSEEATVVADAAQNQTRELAEVSTRVSTLADRASALEDTLDDFELAGGRAATDTGETVVEFWHAMGGEKALLLEELAREFEAETDGVRLSLSSKGSYRGTLDATLNAAENGTPPAIAQIFEIGSTRARNSTYFKPVDSLLDQDHIDSLVDAVTNYYQFDGTLHSLPFNSSNPILAYNADAFRQAGLDPTSAPETLEAVSTASEELVSAGPTEYGITFANYSWFVEQWFAEADELLVDQNNGRSGTPTTTNLNGEFAHSLFEWWTEMESRGLYHDPGIEARGAAKEAFHDKDAAMLIGSTSSLNAIESGADFEVGMAEMPVLDDRTGVLVGGASLWVGEELPQNVHDAVGTFLTWLTEPEQQKRWHRETGYFPVHEDAAPQLRREGWFEENPHYRTAFDQLAETTDTIATRGAQIGPFDTVRTIIEECTDSIETVEDVSGALDRMNRQIELTLDSSSSKA